MHALSLGWYSYLLQIRFNHSRIDRIDSNSIFCQVYTGTPRQLIKSRLWHAISRASHEGLFPIHRTNVDNIRWRRFLQKWYGMCRHLKRDLSIRSHVHAIHRSTSPIAPPFNIPAQLIRAVSLPSNGGRLLWPLVHICFLLLNLLKCNLQYDLVLWVLIM
jgi:hypothetical protein